MNTLPLNDTERDVLNVIAQEGIADPQAILPVLNPELGMYYVAEVLETLYALGLIQEVDVCCYSLCPVRKAA